jgi:transcriptional regulator with XRE-family HTH domain/tetratricopeptide (TPR) repeat protein
MDNRFVQPDRDTIRRLRQGHFWSQEQLADAAGLRKRTVERVEAGARLQRSTIRALAQALRVPPDALVQAAHPAEEPRDGRVGAGEAGSVRDIPAPPEPYIAHPYTLLQTEDLIGRRQELNLFARWVAEPEAFGHARILIMTAIGGAGKSALTWHWFQEGAPRDMRPLAGRLWWSFYQPGVTFDHFVTRALMYVTGRSTEQVAQDPTPGREWRLLEVLTQQPFLVMLDGLERLLMAYARTDASYIDDTVFDEDTATCAGGAIDGARDTGTSPVGVHTLRRTADVRAGQFLRTLAASAGASRILITSRLVPAELETPMGRSIARCAHHALGGLSDEDAITLWHALEVKGSRARMLPVFRIFDHHPLLIQILAGVVANFHPDPGNFDAWHTANPEFNPFGLDLVQVQSHVLACALHSLPPAERRALHVLTACHMPARVEMLTEVLIRTVEADDPAQKPFATSGAFDAGLTDLHDRGLLGWDRETRTYDVHPVVRGVVWRGLPETVKQSVYEALRVYCEAVPPVAEAAITTLEDLEPAIELFHALIGLGRFDDAYQLFRTRLDDALYYRLGAGRMQHELLTHLLPQGPGEASRLSSRLHQALVLHMLAKGAMFLGHLDDAIRRFQEAIDLIAHGPDDGDCDLTVVAGDIHETCHFDRSSDVVRVFLSELSIAQRLSGHLWSAEKAARTALAMSRRLPQIFEAGVNLYRLGLVLSARGAVADAEAVFHQSLAIWQQSCPHREMEGFLHACLARLALWTGNAGDALDLAETACRLFHDNQLAIDLMHGARLQGMAHLALGDLDAADERLHVALTAARTHNRVEEELLTLTPLAELHRLWGERDRAREMLDLVWEPAARGPYPLCHADALTVLARLERDAGRSVEAVAAARRAYELAWCDGPPFAYHWGLTTARDLLLEWGASWPVLPPFGESTVKPTPGAAIDLPAEGSSANHRGMS